MTTRDFRNNIEAMHSLEPAVRPTGTYNGASTDLRGFSAAAVVVYFGAYTNGTHTPAVEHSDDDTTYTAASAAELDGAFTAVSAAGGAHTLQRVGYRGSKRYIRATMTVAAGATGAASAATVIRSEAAQQPL